VEELADVVRAAQAGDLDAFGLLVRRFQDMAYASACALIGDAHLAEDATQEAFLQAYFDLPMLREPAAFPGWFRRIVFKHGDRLTRGKRAALVPLQESASLPDLALGPPAIVERRELHAFVRAEIARLPAHERVTVTLFYLSDHSQAEIAAFLELPVGTVKKRLYDARKRLLRQMSAATGNVLRENRLSLSHRFARKIDFLIAVSTGDLGRVEGLLAQDSSLATISLTLDDWRQAGASRQPSLPMRWGYTPLHLAATYGYITLVDLLLSHGADLDAATCGETPLHRAVMVDDEAMVTALLQRGALVDAVDGNGMTPLHRAVINRRPGIVKRLLEHGASVTIRDKAGRTPTLWAMLKGDISLADLLKDPVGAQHRGNRSALAGLAASVSSGAPSDGPGPRVYAISRTGTARSDQTSATPASGTLPHMLVTGIKAIDLLAPLRRGGTIYLSGVTGVGVMALLGEWTHALWTGGRGRTVFLDWPTRPMQVDDLVREWREQGIERGVTLVLGGLADTRTQRRGMLLAALATAEQLRDEGHDVLFAVVATDTEWNILSRLLDRLPRIVGQGSITLVVLDIWWDGAPTPLSGIRAWDSWIMLDVARAQGGFHPAVDPLASGSGLLAGSLLGEEHRRVASQAKALLQRYPDLDREILHPAADVGYPMNRLHAARAGRLRRFLTQPLFVKESVTGRPGKRVLVEDTISGVARLLDGRYDAVPTDSFLYIGDIDQALEGRRD
jgi:F-type H+-transporting ATPase subunit beta